MRRNVGFAVGSVLCLMGACVWAQGESAEQNGVVLENDLVRMKLSREAVLQEFVCRQTGKDYLAKGVRFPMFTVGRKGAKVPARLIERKGDVLEVRFADPEVKVSIKVETRKRYFTFEVVDVQPDDVEWLLVDLPVKRLGTWLTGAVWHPNITYDKEFAAGNMSLNCLMQCPVYGRGRGGDMPARPMPVLGARCYKRHGIKGAKHAIFGCPFSELMSLIQEIERDNGLPCPYLDGKWVRDPECKPVRQSYLFATRMPEADTDAIIEYAKLGDFGMIMLGQWSWAETLGHYVVGKDRYPEGRESLKRTVDKIHAAGMRAGLHLYPWVSSNDAFASPVPHEGLAYVPCPPLAEDADPETKVITLADTASLPGPTNGGCPGKYLRVGDEIIRYTGTDPGPPFRFAGCRRGQCGTTPAAHAAGTPVRHLLTVWGKFIIDVDTPLLDEAAQHFADLFNTCGFDMVYFDGCNGPGSRDWYECTGWYETCYYTEKMLLAYCSKFKRDVLCGTSGTGHLSWHIVPRSASADGYADIKGYFDRRMRQLGVGLGKAFRWNDIGWYGIVAGIQLDDIEYICGKAMGLDASISISTTRADLEAHPRARQMIEMIAEYEKCRLANFFPENVRAKLREKGREFKLRPDGEGRWKLFRAAYQPIHAISRIDGKQNVWTVENDLKHACRLAIEINRDVLYSAGPGWNSPKALTLEDFNDVRPYEIGARNHFEKYAVGGDRVLTKRGPALKGVTHSLTASNTRAREGEWCGVYTATSTRSDRSGWCAIGKRFPKPVDLTPYEAIALWIHGDVKGKSQFLKIQFWDVAGRHHDFRLRINFKGWQMHTFRIPARSKTDWTKIDYMLFYYNGVPGKTTITCLLDDVKALPHLAKPQALANPGLTVNGRQVRFPAQIPPGQCLTTDGFGGCVLWPGGMKPGVKVDVRAATFTLKPGRNEVKFSCDTSPDFAQDAGIRLIRLWPLED